MRGDKSAVEIKITVVIEAPDLTAAINNLAASFSGMKSVVPPPTPTATATVSAHTQSAVPVAPPPQFTQDQIMQAGAKLMDAGKANELVALLRTFNVRAVMDLKPEQIGAFATAMRELGAEI